MKKTKILLWHWGRKGGGPQYTLELTKALAQDSTLEVHLSLSKQADIFPEFVALNLPGFYIDTYTDRTSAILACFRLYSVRQAFKAYLEQHQIQVVLCTMTHLWNPIVMPVIQHSKIPFVLTVHDAILHPGENYWIRQYLLNQEVKAAQGIIALSQHVKSQLVETYNVSAQNCWVAPHGVFFYDTEQEPKKLPEHRGVRLLFFGRILPYKGLPLLLEAFKILKQEFSDLMLEIVGTGSNVDIESIQNLPGVMLENRWIQEEEINGIFARADLLILPYIEASQSGVAAIAMGCGLPIVATPVGGLKEQVDHLETGIISDEVSAEAIASSIRKLVKDPQLYQYCSAGALRKVEQSLSWSSIGQQISQILQKIARKTV